MQVLQAGTHKLLFLELDTEMVHAVARKAGFECELEDSERAIFLKLSQPDRHGPLLLFDAAEPGNLGLFSRCQFYVDGTTGSVLQTPLFLGNQRLPNGRLHSRAIQVKLVKELPVTFRLPGRSPVTEQMIYAVLFNFLSALAESGVGLCGASVVKPLIGRAERGEPRN